MSFCYATTLSCGRRAGTIAFASNPTSSSSHQPFHQSRHSYSLFPKSSGIVTNNSRLNWTNLGSLPWHCRYFLGTTTHSKYSDNQTGNDKPTSFSGNKEESETHGQPLHRFGSSVKLEQAANRFDLHQYEEKTTAASSYQVDDASEHHADVYNHMPSVNLSACMQSQVPQPYGRTPTHMNMPGGVARREDKYIQGRLSDMSGKREFSTAVLRHSEIQVDEHGNPTYNTKALEKMMTTPCPQGIQGDDCEQFKLWLSNCLQHGNMQECEMLANEYIAGRKTLAQLFFEYDLEIRRVSTTRHLATAGTPKVPADASSSSIDPTDASTDQNAPTGKPSAAARLKAAVRDYGSTVIVFHVTISLASLGIFYVLVASSVDVVSILKYFNIPMGSVESSVGTVSTMTVAYAVHKVFAPVRIATTLTCAPLIVRALRARGILKTPKVPPVSK